MIQLQVIGNLGQDATIKEINGQKCINFSVAISHNYTNHNGEKIESTTWVRCNLWRDRDSLSKYLLKGTKVFVQGKPTARHWFDQNANTTRSGLELRVDTVELLGSARQEATPPAAPTATFTPQAQLETPSPDPPHSPSVNDVYDLPF